MKKIIFLALVAYFVQGLRQNDELRLRFKILNDWMSNFKDDEKPNLDQVPWFKQRIDRFLDVLPECDLKQRADVLSGILFYLERIFEVVKGQGMIEGVSAKQLEEVIHKVKKLDSFVKNMNSGIFESINILRDDDFLRYLIIINSTQ